MNQALLDQANRKAVEKQNVLNNNQIVEEIIENVDESDERIDTEEIVENNVSMPKSSKIR